MDAHKIENLLVKIHLGLKVYQVENDRKTLEEVKKALCELTTILEEI